jgi:hypothetical protein
MSEPVLGTSRRPGAIQCGADEVVGRWWTASRIREIKGIITKMDLLACWRMSRWFRSTHGACRRKSVEPWLAYPLLPRASRSRRQSLTRGAVALACRPGSDSPPCRSGVGQAAGP